MTRHDLLIRFRPPNFPELFEGTPEKFQLIDPSILSLHCNTCAGKSYSDTQTIDGVSVEVALDWNTDKGAYLLRYQGTKFVSLNDDECCEVIHDYQLTHINDCNEAHANVINWDVLNGYYCNDPKSTDTTCAPECQESIDMLESVCNPAGGPIGNYTTVSDIGDATTIQKTYSWVDMAVAELLGPSSCNYTSSLSSAGTLGSPVMVVAAAASFSRLLRFFYDSRTSSGKLALTPREQNPPSNQNDTQFPLSSLKKAKFRHGTAGLSNME
jgi:hypothetical protein